MKLQPPSLPQGGGPSTPPVKGASREDPLEKYRKERLAFIAAMQRCSTAPDCQGEALLVKLTQDPEPEVALAASRAINRILNVHGHMLDPVATLKSFYQVMETTSDGDSTAGSALSVHTEVYLAMDVLWSTINVDELGEELVQKLAERFWETCRNYLEHPRDEGETHDADGGSTDGLRAAAVRAMAASCRRQSGDCLCALKIILEAAKLSYGHLEIQEHAFVLFSEKAAAMPAEMIDAAMLHASMWLRDSGQRATGWDMIHHGTEMYDAALTAVVSFVETTIALGSISEVIDGDLCALLCEYAEARINGGVNDHDIASKSATGHSTNAAGGGTVETGQSATVILQVLARLVNERETFSLVVSKRVSLLEKICASCLDDLEGPMLLPSLFLIGHVSKVSPDACRFVSLTLREANGADVASALVLSLAHTKQDNIRQVAAWVLGVLGSSSSPAASHVAAAGGLLTLMDTTRRGEPDGTLALTCRESCVAIISRLDCLATLIALLKLEMAGDDGTVGGGGGDNVDCGGDEAGIAADAGKEDKEEEEDEEVDESEKPRNIEQGRHGRESRCRVVPHQAQEALFRRIAQLLDGDLSLRTEFVQQGALEALIALGEMRPELEADMAHVCNLYPQELVDRCSPKYMRKLIEQYKRESCCIPPAPTELASATDSVSPRSNEPFSAAKVDEESVLGEGLEVTQEPVRITNDNTTRCQ